MTPPPAPVPQTLRVYQAYRGLLLLVYAVLCGLGVWALGGGGVAPEQGGGRMGGALLVLGAGGAALVVGSFRLPHAAWSWRAHLVLICLGVPLVLTTPLALFLLWAWLHPAVKAHFGVEGSA